MNIDHEAFVWTANEYEKCVSDLLITNYITQNLTSIEFPSNRIIKSDSILNGSYLVHYTNIAFHCDEIPFTTCYTPDARRPIFGDQVISSRAV